VKLEVIKFIPRKKILYISYSGMWIHIHLKPSGYCSWTPTRL